MSDFDMERANREEIRWRILKVLDAGRPSVVGEPLLLRVLQDAALRVTPHGLRRELDYLEDRKLICISNRSEQVWGAELTHYGVDIVEYTIDCLPGIARPPKWY